MAGGSNAWIKVGAVVGALLSLYAMYTEAEMKAAKAMGQDYRAGCDIGLFASGSKVLGSRYAHILSAWGLVPAGSAADLSNAFMGLLFYAAVAVHNYAVPPAALLAASLGSLAYTAYLAYILKFVLHDACLVCFGMYAANFAIFIGAARLALAPLPRAKVH